MNDAEGRYERVSSLYESNPALLTALAVLAPEGNVRVALVNLIEFVADPDTDQMIDVRVVLEILTRGIITLGFDPIEGEDGYDEDMSELSLDDAIVQFRKQLGIEED